MYPKEGAEEEVRGRERFEDATLLALKKEGPTSQGMQTASRNETIIENARTVDCLPEFTEGTQPCLVLA